MSAAATCAPSPSLLEKSKIEEDMLNAMTNGASSAREDAVVRQHKESSCSDSDDGCLTSVSPKTKRRTTTSRSVCVWREDDSQRDREGDAIPRKLG